MMCNTQSGLVSFEIQGIGGPDVAKVRKQRVHLTSTLEDPGVSHRYDLHSK
jgi:hypothetical protein